MQSLLVLFGLASGLALNFGVPVWMGYAGVSLWWLAAFSLVMVMQTVPGRPNRYAQFRMMQMRGGTGRALAYVLIGPAILAFLLLLMLYGVGRWMA